MPQEAANTLFPMLKPVPKTGVIYVLEKAVDAGYSPTDPTWSNLGQGAPETGALSGEDTTRHAPVNATNSEYAPVRGTLALRQQIAAYYNQTFRRHHSSQYTYKNVCIAGGGRMALSRLVAALGSVNMGHFIPDYTAYEELLAVFQNFVPIPITLRKEQGYTLTIDALRDEIVSKGLSALLLSNPCNPTGQVIQGKTLAQWVALATQMQCLTIYDEFYSHFLYTQSTRQPSLLSAAEYVTDVNKDPIVVINGMSKNWRCPGWRVGWLLGPEPVIERVASVGSFLDGGAVHPLQQEAVLKINPDTVSAEAAEIQRVFKAKREYAVTRLTQLGVRIDVVPAATFYLWCDLSELPEPLRDCQAFFWACLAEKVIVVPGLFFDINPGKRRLKKHSRFNSYVRISFGPTMDSVVTGIDAISRVIAAAKQP